MIPHQILTYLISSRLKDAKALIQNKRFPISIYIAGYGIELALKYRICQTLRFDIGFLETKQELNNYLAQVNANSAQPLAITISDIRNHDLNSLLFYSGAELRIKGSFFNEWTVVCRWNPESRYRRVRVTRKMAESYLKSARKIIREIE